jgi:toxin ParE1/3/4
MSDKNSQQRKLIVHQNATNDIDNTTDYLTVTVSVTQAVRFQNAVADAMEYLLTMPYLGAPHEVQNPLLQGMRKFPIPEFRKYLIFYLTPDGDIEIVRILHTSQNTDAILEAEILE